MKNGFISKIQRYSTKDGPGLRSTVFLVGCNLRCLWCSNPELIETGPKILYHPELCQRSGACVSLSHGTIRLTDDGCVIDRDACDNLAECAAACYYDAYETVGYSVSPDDLVEQLARDKVFYDQSGGGVTFSGGDPVLQRKFVKECARSLRSQGIHVALDTAGLVQWEKLKPLAESVDLVLFDIKAYDSDIHKACTGVDNAMILDNARQLAAMGKDMIIRMVVVPGHNDQSDDVDARLHFVAELGSAVKRLDILKLHRLGIGKYHSLGLSCPIEDTPDCPESVAEEIVDKACSLGLNATVGG